MSYITYEVIVFDDGSKYWELNGKRHREDGPAVEYSDGHKGWYLNGKKCTEEEFNKKMSSTVEMTMSEIEELVGKKVKVIK